MLHVEREGAVVHLTIDRQAKRNAVDHGTLAAMGDALDHAVATGARAVVLSGAGGNFSAGADLSGVEDSSFLDALRRVLSLLSEAPLVTIAAVEGAALGAGTQLASFCDLRVATPTARFGIPAAKLGIVVDQATVARVVELAGSGTARAMLLAAETVDGTAAHALGMVQRIGSLEDALAWAAEIALLAPLTVAAHKLALRAVSASIRGASDAEARAAFHHAWASEDLQEGRTAFLQRRPPVFRGK